MFTFSDSGAAAPPAYAGGVLGTPAPPVFSQPSNGSSQGGFVIGNNANSSSNGNRAGGGRGGPPILGGDSFNSSATAAPTSTTPILNDINSSSSVPNTGVPPPAAPPLPVGGLSRNPNNFGSSPFAGGPMPLPPPHRQFDMKAPSTPAPFGNATPAAGSSGILFGGPSTSSVLSTESKAAIFPTGNSSSSRNQGSVLNTPPSEGHAAGKAPPPFNARTFPTAAAAVRNTGFGGTNTSSSNTTNGGSIPVLGGSTSSFKAPFGWSAVPAALTGDAGTPTSAPSHSSIPANTTTTTTTMTSMTPPPSANASGKGNSAGGVLGSINGTATGATSAVAVPPSDSTPLKAAFGPPPAASSALSSPSPFRTATASTTDSTNAGTMKSSFGAPTVNPPPPPPPPPAAAASSVFTSAFSADGKPSAFAPSTSETKPSTAATSVFAPSATSAFKSASSTAPAAAAATTASLSQSFPPAPTASKSVFSTSSSNSQGGHGGGGGRGRGDDATSPRGRGRDGGRGGGRRDRRRGRSPSPPEGMEDASFHGEDGRAGHPSQRPPPATPAQTPSFSIPAPRHAQQQQQHQRQPQAPPPPQQQQKQQQQSPTTVSRTEKLPLPSLPSDEKQWSLAARVCKSFLLQLATPSSTREAGTATTLEQAFFGVVGHEGVSGDFATTVGEMLAVWQTHVRPVLRSTSAASSASTFPGEMWVTVFAIGTYLNTILSTLTAPRSTAHPSASADLAAYKAGLRDHPAAALTDACHYANELSELLQTLFQRGGGSGEAEAPPYSVLPVVLRRVRTVFDEATLRGVATVQSNLNAVTSKLFAVLNRRVKAAAVQPMPSSPTATATDKATPRWVLTYDSKETESLLHSFAALVSEMIAVDAPMNDDVELFVAAFHAYLPSALAERCLLYYRRACALLRQPLSVQQVVEAAELLAKALAVYPPDTPPHNKRVLEVKLLTAELALGRLPPDDARIALDVPQLTDVVNALKTSRLDLLDAALKFHGPFFVQVGVHNALLLARQRIALLMVVKYYVTHGCENRLHVPEMVRYHRLPYSTSEASMVWLLPLLMEKRMNGVLDHEYLILSGKTPFDEYPRELLASAAGLS